jgi:hypothetical protein
MILRRFLLLLLVCLSASQIPGCATPAQICDVKHYTTGPIPVRGEVVVSWRLTHLKEGLYEWTVCDRSGKSCHIDVTNRPDYNAVCRLADLGHGVLHAAGVPHN